MNRLPIEKRAQVLGCLVEGNSIRATSRMTGASKNTITKLPIDVGRACSEYQDQAFRARRELAARMNRFQIARAERQAGAWRAAR